MNFRVKNQSEKSELVVKEVIFPSEKDEAGTSQSFLRHSDDCEEQTVVHPVQIADHEVKPVTRLKVLEKKPLENYFGGAKQKKQSKRKPKTKRVVYNLNNFDCAVLENDKNDMPTTHSDLSTEEITEEMIKDNQLQLKIYKYQKTKECSERKNHIQQRLAERNHFEELESLAETWEEYKKRRHQLKESGTISRLRDPSRRNPSFYNRMSFSIISRKYWNDDKESKTPRKDKNKEVKKAGEDTRQVSKYGDLGEELLQKLVFVYNDDSDDPPS